MNNITNIGTNALEGFIEDLTLVRIPPWWQSPWFVLLILAALALLVLAGRRWWLRRKLRVPMSEVKSTPSELPHIAALRRLRELRERMAKLAAYEFCTECSLILREYIAVRFKLAIIYQTTREFLEHAQTNPALGPDHREKLGQYLHFADGVKFGRRDMSRDEMGKMIDYAEAFVNSSAANGGRQ